jgi:hypothetical protein
MWGTDFSTNVTNRFTGEYYRFQPFADLRFRLGFADSVNMSAINLNVNYNLGRVASSIIVPGLPPEGSFDDSFVPRYHYDLTEMQNLLLDAMQHPLTRFTFRNGTVAPPGTFDNTFGCLTLNAQNQCDNPVSQTIEMYYPTGDTFHETILTTIASNINSVSATYNMGLLVTVVPIPIGQMYSSGNSGQLYAFGAMNWGYDYPWSMDALGPALTAGGSWYGGLGQNLTRMTELYKEAVAYSHSGDDSNLVRVTHQMVRLADQQVMMLYEVYPLFFFVMTSNIHGYYFNPSVGAGGVFFYFATMY